MGNICRSPTAEAVFRHQVEQAGQSLQIQTDSAGTHAYHIGDAPDLRSQQAAGKRGYDLSRLRGRQVTQADFYHYDYLLAMDSDNLAILQALAPPESRAQLRLFLEFARHHQMRDVPDPYYGGAMGFEQVLDLIEDASAGLLQHLDERSDPGF